MKFKRIVCMLILFLIVFQTGISVYAKTPYASYFLAYADTNDDGGWTLPTPAAYLPLETLDFVSTEEGKLSSPEDMFLKDDLLYVCDTGNNRIVVYQKDENGSFKFKYIIADPTKLSADDPARLNSPMGLFVDDNGTILVADTGNKRLVEFTKYGNLRYVYNQPDNPILHYDGFVYSPLKVIKDSRGYIYVSNSGDYHGLMMFNDKGEFQKYFGANKVALTFFEAISRLFWSREARLGTEVKLPYSFNNVLATSDAIYTTTTGTGVQVRKLNSAGSDIMFNPDQNYNDFNVTWYAPSFDPKQQVFCDVAVDSDENMTILDNSYGRIYQYDSIGRNLFAFGTTGPAPSQFTDPVGLEIDDLGNIYVLDKATGTITVFKPTEFANLVHEANRYNIDGKYDLSLPLWNTVLQMDSYYVNALNAMGESYIRQEKYSDAMKVLKISENYEDYSTAFSEMRGIFIKDNFAVLAISVIVFFIALMVFLSIRRKRKEKNKDRVKKPNFFSPVSSFFGRITHVSFHPLDGFDGIRYENQGSYIDAAIIMVLYYGLRMLSLFATSFIYRYGTPMVFWVDWKYQLEITFLPWVVLCIVNYAVTTIMYGEGRFRDIVIGGAYCHVPLMLLVLPMALITQVLSAGEMSFYSLIYSVIYIWVFFLAFFCIKGVHGYNPIKAIVISFFTILGVLIVVILFLIMYGLTNQFFEFLSQFIKELMYLG